MDNSILINQWIKSLKENKLKRSYHHLDVPVDLKDPKNILYMKEKINNLEKHQFLPFIKSRKRVVKFKRKSKTEKIKSVKIRNIMYASHIDAHIYAYYNFILNKKYEEYILKNNIQNSVIAYRKITLDDSEKGKSNIHFSKEVIEEIKSKKNCIVISVDIKSFFDNLDHVILKKSLINILNSDKLDSDIYKIFKSLTKYKYIDHDVFITNKFKSIANQKGLFVFNSIKGSFKQNLTGIGIPQGSPISGLLSNIYLINLDLSVKNKKPDVFYRRYCDDIIFVCGLRDYDDLLDLISSVLLSLKLETQEKKTFVHFFKEDGEGVVRCDKITDRNGTVSNKKYLDYLGVEYDGSTRIRSSTLTNIRSKNLLRIKIQNKNLSFTKLKKPKTERSPSTKKRNIYLDYAAKILPESSIGKQSLKIKKIANKYKGKINNS